MTFFCSLVEQSRCFLVSRDITAHRKRRVAAYADFLFPVRPGWFSWGFVLPDRRSSKGGKPGNDRDRGKKTKDEAMGTALRTVYHDAVSEPVPDEMLDLLRKLG
jgi:hypothetical protein